MMGDATALLPQFYRAVFAKLKRAILAKLVIRDRWYDATAASDATSVISDCLMGVAMAPMAINEYWLFAW